MVPTRHSPVISRPKRARENGSPYLSFIFRAAEVADACPPWTTDANLRRSRDKVLRAFWKTEDILKNVIYSVCTRYAAMQWSLVGAVDARDAAHDMLNMCEDGKGVWATIMKTTLDELTQDNFGFTNIIRTANDPEAPTVALKHLDSARCWRTGVYEQPVIYWDSDNHAHILRDYQVEDFGDFPAPEDEAYGAGLCAVSRILEDARYMRDVAIFQHEKVSGRNPRAVHFVGGVSGRALRRALDEHKALSERKGQLYIDPPIVPGNDPTTTVSKVTLEMASLYDGFDDDKAKRWYYQCAANAVGWDSQDLIPLPGGNLGTSQQSNNLSMKGNTKGPALFQLRWTHFMNYRAILPRGVEFTYAERDPVLEMQQLQKASLRIKNLTTMMGTANAPGFITPEVARQIAVRNGDLPAEYLEMFGETLFGPQLISVGPGGG
jgi:hypothetical protein